MKEKEELHIALAADSNYIMPVTVVLQSLFANNRDVQIHVYLLHLESQMEDKDLCFFSDFIREKGGTFYPLPVQLSLLNVFPETRHGKSALLRLCLPALLSEQDKILYVDGDIVIKGNLKDLFQSDVTNYYVAAVKDTCTIYNIEYQKALGIDEDFSYFNSGVTLLNLKLLREINLFDEAVLFARKHHQRMSYPDQDVLNYICQKGKVLYLPPKYNINYNVEKDVMAKIWSKVEVSEAKLHPVIVHFIGPVKPWSMLCIHPQRKYWWNYLKQTPFREFQPENKNLKNRMYRIYLQLTKPMERKLTLTFKQQIGAYIPKRLKRSIKQSLMKRSD